MDHSPEPAPLSVALSPGTSGAASRLTLVSLAPSRVADASRPASRESIGASTPASAREPPVAPPVATVAPTDAPPATVVPPVTMPPALLVPPAPVAPAALVVPPAPPAPPALPPEPPPLSQAASPKTTMPSAQTSLALFMSSPVAGWESRYCTTIWRRPRRVLGPPCVVAAVSARHSSPTLFTGDSIDLLAKMTLFLRFEAHSR